MAQTRKPIEFPCDLPSWVPITTIVLLHIGALAAPFFPSQIGFAALLVLYILSGLGIVVGYHRLLAHRSFRTRRWMERVLATFGALAQEGGPGNWVALHRLHHAHSDSPFDPHDASRGFFHSHVGWITKQLPHEFLRIRYTTISRDLLEDPYLRWLNSFHYVPNIAIALVLLMIGGLPAFLWGICLRIVLVHHATWLVNSAAHLWGTKPYSNAAGFNNRWVALLTMGEGWHNNHHAYPRSARCGLDNSQVDFAWWFIALLEKLTLADRIHLIGSVR